MSIMIIFQFSAQIIKKKNNDEIPINQNESVDNISMEDQKDEINLKRAFFHVSVFSYAY